MDQAFSPYLAFGWCMVAGFLMSMGAGGGGILVGIGHLSVLGIADPNMIKAVNQMMEFTSRILTVPLYYRQQRLVWSLAAAFGIGSPIGAIAGSWFSKAYLSDIAVYRAVFGVLVALVAARVLYEAYSKKSNVHAGLRKAREASDRAAAAARQGKVSAEFRPRTTRFSLREAVVSFAGGDFTYSPMTAMVGGFCISFVGSMVGVGGGFLVTPFMATILLLPMYLVIGTGLVALMIPLTASVLTYMALDVTIDWRLVAFEVPGILAGSLIGPMLNKRMNEKALKSFVALTLLVIGVYYIFS